MQRRIICQYYVISGLMSLAGLSLISATYVTFLIKNGLSLFQVNLVNASFFLTLFICEIPTGAFADIFGRKKALVASCTLLSLSAFIYGNSRTFAGFILAEVIGALGCTFSNGAFKAWLVDSLKHQGGDFDMNKIFARENVIDQICGGVGAVLGSYLLIFGPAGPWYSSSIGLGLLAVVAHVVVKEEYFMQKKLSWRAGLYHMREVAVKSVRYGIDHSAVRFVLVTTFLQILAVQALNMYWQPFFRDKGLSEKHLGWLFAGMMAGLSAGAYLISKMSVKGKERRLICILQILTGIIIVLAVSMPGLGTAAIAFMIHEMPRGASVPLKSAYLHERIPSEERATIDSFCSVSPHIGGVFGLLLSGAIAQRFGIPASWMVSAGIFIVGSLVLIRKSSSPID